ncbi:DNA-protecting protein DprA [Streptomyces sp. ventii]|uniref:DNA-protecting protein DprA n=2 Tax=Streptomyces spiramenti TaxID=2720606 RepID=A0ABX1AIP9_9ACTN|nr:DNA-processing protein DprA [Streptomyces spiramenti]NJP65541.1 DNA-protecting protein DprA [Streptomyces spiramenti]
MGTWLAGSGPVAVWHALRDGAAGHGLSPRRWEGLRHRVRRADPADSLGRAAMCEARFVCPGDAEWPTQLTDLGVGAPVGLWVRGTASLRMLALRSVAVVGARACTDYGAWVAADLARSLAGRGWTVASGAAYGIDGAAHQGALRGGGPTVAVVASGVDSGYPAGHAGLLDRVREQGLVVSELPPGSHPTRHRFLQRNRLLAALTRGTVVVEAAPRSGALATARRATALGRHVMGVPGSVLSAQSDGVHQLLRGGAQLVCRAEEVIELVGAMGELADLAETADPRDLLGEPAGRVLGAVPPRGSASVAQIAADACCGVARTHASLSELSALGYVERVGESWALRRTAPADAPSARPGRD